MFRVFAAFTLLLCLILMFSYAFSGEVDDLSGFGGERNLIEVDQGLSVLDLKSAGFNIFNSRFTKADGYGDERPTIQQNGTFLRANGLDAQSCLECHHNLSNAEFPPLFGDGGSGDLAQTVFFKPSFIISDDGSRNNVNGRIINSPALFGAGVVDALGLEMTRDLQALKEVAIASPGQPVDLVTKGINFGQIVADESGNIDTLGVVGVDPDLVVKPFGRKGEFKDIRDFVLGAFKFHFGLEPIETFGEGDPDGDGVENEVTPEQVDALTTYVILNDDNLPTVDTQDGRDRFNQVGCADCHTALELINPVAKVRELDVVLTDVIAIPDVVIELFSDMKRHDMVDGLAESFDLATPQQNREFITAKLWGVADSAPYLHDGRALTLKEAILAHGGDAEESKLAFEALPEEQQAEVVGFLKGLKNPRPVVETEEAAEEVVEEEQ